MTRFSLITLLLLCCTNAIAQPCTHIERIDLSNSGGFTGGVFTHRILKNGEVYYLSQALKGIAKDSLLFKVKKKEIKTLFRQIAMLRIDTLNFQEVGNSTNTIVIAYKSSTLAKKISWGEGDTKTPANLLVAYSRLLAFIEKNRPKQLPSY